MSQKKATARLENWKIEGDRAHGKAYGREGFPEGWEVRTSAIVVNGAPNYVETKNTIYLLGEPMAQPLSGIQNQAMIVVKQALLDDVTKDGGSLLAEYMGPTLVAEAAEGTAKCAIRALIAAGLLVQ